MNRPLRILFISRATLFTVKGGDTVQMIKTAEELKKLGVDVDIKLCDDTEINYSYYDLIHFFNIIRPADILIHVCADIPFVISTIFVEYIEYEKYAGKNSWKKRLFNMFSSDTKEYLKVIGRFLLNGQKINSTKYIWWGQSSSIRYLIKKSALLLPNSESEYKRLVNNYGLEKDYVVVNNAADANVFNITAEQIKQKESKMLLCVGRIEGRKNQLNLIKAVNNTAYNLYLIGDPAPNHISYYEECKRIAGKNIHFIKQLSQEELVKYYQKASIHILPSWFETTGLSSLEALFCGCKIVVTKYGDTMDYFDPAFCVYCEPGEPDYIRRAIEEADNLEINQVYIEQCTKKYSWKEAGKKTLQAYQQVL